MPEECARVFFCVLAFFFARTHVVFSAVNWRRHARAFFVCVLSCCCARNSVNFPGGVCTENASKIWLWQDSGIFPWRKLCQTKYYKCSRTSDPNERTILYIICVYDVRCADPTRTAFCWRCYSKSCLFDQLMKHQNMRTQKKRNKIKVRAQVFAGARFVSKKKQQINTNTHTHSGKLSTHTQKRRYYYVPVVQHCTVHVD